jgi:hypothetical protein
MRMAAAVGGRLHDLRTGLQIGQILSSQGQGMVMPRSALNAQVKGRTPILLGGSHRSGVTMIRRDG